jgi:predicted transcriptional regulator
MVLGYRRDATRVMYDILSLAKRRVSKTQMVYRANLNFHIIDGYIRYLLSKTFIRKSDDEGHFTVYELTERGQRLLQLLEELYSPSLLSYSEKPSGTVGRAGRVS